MTFAEAETLFHEFGHGLQHMLTDVEEGDVAGINNVEWDAVELPSQFMENWLYHQATVDSFAIHYQTGEPLPAEIFEKIKGSRVFMAASGMLRQLQFGALDMELHARYNADSSEEGPMDVQRRIAAKYAVLPPVEEDRFLCSFSHIFASSYSAGYYSYKWAEVLSADAFAAFEEAGLEDDAALATAASLPALTSMYIILAAANGRGAVVTLMGNGTSTDVLPLKGPGSDEWFVVQTNVDHWVPMSDAATSSHRREHVRSLLVGLGPDAPSQEFFAVLQDDNVFPPGNAGADDGRVFRPSTIASVMMRPSRLDSAWASYVWRTWSPPEAAQPQVLLQ